MIIFMHALMLARSFSLFLLVIQRQSKFQYILHNILVVCVRCARWFQLPTEWNDECATDIALLKFNFQTRMKLIELKTVKKSLSCGSLFFSLLFFASAILRNIIFLLAVNCSYHLYRLDSLPVLIERFEYVCVYSNIAIIFLFRLVFFPFQFEL